MVTRGNLLKRVAAPRSAALLEQAALASASNEKAAKIAAEMNASRLANTIVGLIKKQIPVGKQLSDSAITVLTESNTKNATTQKVLDVLANALRSQGQAPPVTVAACPLDSIGDVYFANRKAGCAFGTPTNPMFRLAQNGTEQTSYKGWKLVPRPSSGNRIEFDFVKEEYSGQNKKNIATSVSNHFEQRFCKCHHYYHSRRSPSKTC
jgi:hypothetical protein